MDLDYYDPARQEDPSEHDSCCWEEGEIWFGHGMVCRYPILHPDLLLQGLKETERVAEFIAVQLSFDTGEAPDEIIDHAWVHVQSGAQD